MNLVELQRALRQLRLSGMATGLEMRLLQAQTEKLAPIDFLPRSSAMNCCVGRIGFSIAASSRPASATWARRSIPSISTSTRR